MEDFPNLISGEYAIVNKKYSCGELQVDIALRIVTDESCKNNFAEFSSELETLLKKYAI